MAVIFTSLVEPLDAFENEFRINSYILHLGISIIEKNITSKLIENIKFIESLSINIFHYST